MKKGLGLILGLIISMTLVSCVNANKVDNSVSDKSQSDIYVAEQKPEDAITDFFTKFKSCNFEAIEKDLITNSNMDLKDIEDYSKDDKKAINYWLEKVSYEIINVKVNDNVAVANVKVSALDGNKIYDKVNENLSREDNDIEKEDEVVNILKDPSNEIVSKNVDIKLEKENGKWLIELSEELLTAICGGLNPEKLRDK